MAMVRGSSSARHTSNKGNGLQKIPTVPAQKTADKDPQPANAQDKEHKESQPESVFQKHNYRL